MSDLFTSLAGNLPLMAGLILAVLALLVVLLLVLLGRARDVAQYASLESDAPVEAESADALRQVDFRTSPREGELRHSFRQALALMQRYLPGRASRYQLPWFLSLGQTAGGKTTLLGQTELTLPFGEPEQTSRAGSPACLWWFFDRAIVLDVAGDLMLRLDGSTSDRPAWRELLRLLRASRHRRPLDGALLVLPVTALAGFDPGDSKARSDLAHRAELLHDRLEEARSLLKFQFPVYVMVTQCDRLPGFSDLAAVLSPAQRHQMFGWSNPNAPDVPYADAWVDDAFDSVLAALDQQQLQTLGEDRPLAEPQAFVSLPATVDSLREAVRIYWNQIFSGGGDDGALPVRGLYFGVGEGFGLPGDDAPHQLSPGYRTQTPLATGGAHRRVDFAADLFGYKILYEWNLARPLDSALKALRRTRTALQAALAAALLLGPLVLGWSGRRVERDATELTRQFLEPSREALEHEGTRDPRLRQDATTLLQAAGQVPDYRLRSVFLPPSWWSSHARNILQAGSGVYARVVFPALDQSLDERLDAVATSDPPLPPPAPIDDLDSVPEYHILEATMTQLGQIETDAGLYDRFTAADPVAGGDCLEDFQRLVASFERDLAFEPPTGAARRYYRNILCDLTGIAPFDPGPGLTSRVQDHVLDLADRMSLRLFSTNVLVGDLDDLERQLNELIEVPPPGQATEVYGRLVATIDRTQADLGRPELAWAGQPTLDLGAPYKTLLASIAKSRFLGPALAGSIQKTDSQSFDAFRARLAAYSTEATGPLLVQKDGAAQLQLTASILGLRTALAALLTGYVEPPRVPRLLLDPPAGTYLSWNAQRLGGAATQLTNYQTFMGKSFAGFPGFQQVVDQATRGTVELNVLDQVAQAQGFPATPVVSSPELREAFLQTQVDNLQAAGGSLNQLLQGFVKPPPLGLCSGPPATAFCLLNRTLLNQKLTLLQQLDGLLLDQNLYAPTPGGIAGWDGQGNLAWSAFSVVNAAGLSTYLTNQRRIVQTLGSRYATPILSGVSTSPGWGIDTAAPFRRWKVLLSDLQDYQNKVPDNPLQLLETFIATDMSGATLASCLAVTPAGLCFGSTTAAELTVNPPPCDFFLDARNDLQEATEQRCLALNATAGDAAYRRIAAAFNARLRGKYPFVEPVGATAPPATPPDLAAFFAVYDAEKPKVDALLGGRPAAPWTPATTAAIRDFLADLQDVRGFFAVFLAQNTPQKPAVPTYTLGVDLRPAPATEAGGNELIDRLLQTGPVTVSWRAAPPAKPPQWSYGMPMAVTLRWAQDSPAVPMAPPGDGDARVNGRTVTYEFTDPWSLVRLLREQGSDSGLLLFEVPTERQQASGSGSSASIRTLARILLSVVPATPDDKQTPLPLPDFPVEAPAP